MLTVDRFATATECLLLLEGEGVKAAPMRSLGEIGPQNAVAIIYERILTI